MSRLIDADALLRDIEHYHLSDGRFQHWVEIQPTIEPKKGKWIYNPDPMPGEGFWRCSSCGLEAYDYVDFCPNCGSDNRGGQDEGIEHI